MKINKQYLTEAEEEKALSKLMEEGKKQRRMTKKEQEVFTQWLRNSSTFKS